MTQKPERRTAHKTRYPVFLGVRVSEEMKTEIEVLAEDWDVGMADVVRHALRLGLPEVGGVPTPAGAQEGAARQWWAQLDRRGRRRWGRRLSHIEGLEAVQEEAYRRSQHGERA